MISHSGVLRTRVWTLEHICSLSSLSDYLARFFSLTEITFHRAHPVHLPTHLHLPTACTPAHPIHLPTPTPACLPSRYSESAVSTHPALVHPSPSPLVHSRTLLRSSISPTHFPFSPFHCSIPISTQTHCYSFPSKTQEILTHVFPNACFEFLFSFSEPIPLFSTIPPKMFKVTNELPIAQPNPILSPVLSDLHAALDKIA